MIYLFTIKGDSVYKGEYYIDRSKNIYCYSYDIYTVTYDKVAKKDVDFSSGIIMLGDKLKDIENAILDISIHKEDNIIMKFPFVDYNEYDVIYNDNEKDGMFISLLENEILSKILDKI